MTLVFSGFSFILHLAPHLASLSRSFLQIFHCQVRTFTHEYLARYAGSFVRRLLIYSGGAAIIQNSCLLRDKANTGRIISRMGKYSQ